MARRATESDEDVNCLSNKINNLQRVFRGAHAKLLRLDNDGTRCGKAFRLVSRRT
jgi:hypothetical protein